jgi:hypothetical protein
VIDGHLEALPSSGWPKAGQQSGKSRRIVTVVGEIALYLLHQSKDLCGISQFRRFEASAFGNPAQSWLDIGKLKKR